MRVAVAIGLTLAGAAARAEPPVAVATRLAEGESIRVDGRLDEPAWAMARPISGFLQRDPVEGQPALEPTEVRFLFDADALYVGARMHSKDASRIRAPVSRRDDDAQADSFGICLDTFHDKRTAYAFLVTAGGVRLDGYFPQDDEWYFDNSLDLVWQAQVSRDAGGWSAEMRIPFTQLRFPRDTDTWGLNARRFVPARNEEDLWALVGKQQNGWASRFGTLTGISGIRGGRRRELLPYVAADSVIRSDRDPANPFDVAARPSVRAGGDFKLAVGPSLMLEGTVAPDFGQVEADPAEVNLTAFETFFPEKRPFFVEGAEMLQPLYGQPVFYSRRIGAAPRGPAEGAYVDYPRATTILGAAKLTGRTAGGTSIGALAALTGREAARVAGVGGPALEVAVAPPTGYLVGHVLHPFGKSQSTVAGTATMVQRGLGSGGPLAELLPRSGAVRCPAAVGREQVQVRMPLDEISGRGDRDDEAGAGVVAEAPADELGRGLGGSAAKLGEQLAPAAEERPQQPRDGQDKVAVPDRGQHLLAQPLGPQELTLLLARGAERAPETGEGHQHASAALGAPQTGEAMLEQAALEKLPQHSLDHRSKSTPLPSEARGPHPQQLLQPCSWTAGASLSPPSGAGTSSSSGSRTRATAIRPAVGGRGRACRTSAVASPLPTGSRRRRVTTVDDHFTVELRMPVAS